MFGDKQLISLGVETENLTGFYVFSQCGRGRIAPKPGLLGSPGISRGADIGLQCLGRGSPPSREVLLLPGWFSTGSCALCCDEWAFSFPCLSWALTDGLDASRLFPSLSIFGFQPLHPISCILSAQDATGTNREGRGRSCTVGRRGF